MRQKIQLELKRKRQVASEYQIQRELERELLNPVEAYELPKSYNQSIDLMGLKEKIKQEILLGLKSKSKVQNTFNRQKALKRRAAIKKAQKVIKLEQEQKQKIRRAKQFKIRLLN